MPLDVMVPVCSAAPPAIGLACEEAHRRGLTGAVTADQTNAHAFIDTETCVVDELTGTDTQ